MKKLKLIYNPNSGNKSFKNDIDSCVHIFQSAGYEVHLFKSLLPEDIDTHLSSLDVEYNAVVISGGDGSINLTINAMMKNNLQIPLGIIPSGTANDFANYLKLPNATINAAQIIADGHTLKADVGLANDKYFINVCGSGLFTNISQNVDDRLKSMLGKLAYYIKGIEQLPNFYPMNIQITNSKGIFNENLYLYIVLNTSGTGGFANLSPDALINDGLLDFIGLREMPIKDLAVLLIKLLKTEHLEDPNVIFFRDSNIKIEIIGDADDALFSETDIDGEIGPKLPLEIKIINRAIDIFAPCIGGNYELRK